MSSLTLEQVKELAKMARLELTSQELEKYTKELDSALSYISKLKELDLKDIELGTCAHLGDYSEKSGNVLREDKPIKKNCLKFDEIFLNTGQRKYKNYFVINKNK